MSDSVMITLIICFTVIFVSLIFAIVSRWICIVTLNNRQKRAEDEYLTIDEFQEYENIIAEALKEMEEKVRNNKNDKD